MKLTTLNTDIIGMKLDEIELRHHNPEWLKIGRYFSSELSALLKNHKQRHFIDHVGSTSIPNIKAKPIIDLTIVADDDDNCRKIIENTFENSINGSEWLTHFWDELTDKILCNVHVFHFTEHEWRYFFGIKKYLIENPNEAKKYERVKFDAFKKYPNHYNNYSICKCKYLHALANQASETYRNEFTGLVDQIFN